MKKIVAIFCLLSISLSAFAQLSESQIEDRVKEIVGTQLGYMRAQVAGGHRLVDLDADGMDASIIFNNVQRDFNVRFNEVEKARLSSNITSVDTLILVVSKAIQRTSK